MKKILTVAILLVFLAGMQSCKKWLDINTNPAVPQETQAEFLLPPIIFQMSNALSQDYRVLWKVTQDMVGASANNASVIWEMHGYPDASDVGGVLWRMTYVDMGLNLENMINDGKQNKKYEYVGIGYAIKAWAYQMTTDLYGPIILDEAFDEKYLAFPYHDQSEVYAKVRRWTDTAFQYLDMTSPQDYSSKLSSFSGDNIYQGNKLKWKKFLYGLLALQYSHLVNKPEFKTQYADSVVKYVDLSFANESESALIRYSATSTDDTNPWGPTYNYLYSPTDYYARPTTTILGYLTGGVRGTPVEGMKTSPDPRLSRLLAPSSAKDTYGEYLAAEPLGTTNNGTNLTAYGPLAPGETTFRGRYLFTDVAKFPLMTYTQLQFAKAEALFYKNKSQEAHTAYINGIKGHMDFYNRYGRTVPQIDTAGKNTTTIPGVVAEITSAEINTYLASTEVAQNPAELTLADIMGQKYIAQWGWATMEQWCDLRKYHYDPAIYRQYMQLDAGQLSSRNKGKYAYRFRPRYNSEYVWNTKELEKWGGLDPDYMTKELWFSLP
ncbi:SusD/RagB family nutrient-binding outer membrane lipoprotein [Niabella hirudinis]|uniref:SusD/RagB family nutrient-binding outer membrane lipoprotein n=1 Tax=Niabella hirudinis TaxID=1285929 RepID=UPI003EBFD7AD